MKQFSAQFIRIALISGMVFIGFGYQQATAQLDTKMQRLASAALMEHD